MSILFKIFLAVVSTVFCVALVYTICRVWKRRISYHGPCNIACQDEPHNKNSEKCRTKCLKNFITITEHLKHIFESGELQADVVCRKFRHTTQHGAIEGKIQTKEVTFYNLDAIISVGYRVKSLQGTQFRIWATQRLKEYRALV